MKNIDKSDIGARLRAQTKELADTLTAALKDAHAKGLVPKMGFVLVTYVPGPPGVSVAFASTADKEGTLTLLKGAQDRVISHYDESEGVTPLRRQLEMHDTVCGEPQCDERTRLVAAIDAAAGRARN